MFDSPTEVHPDFPLTEVRATRAISRKLIPLEGASQEIAVRTAPQPRDVHSSIYLFPQAAEDYYRENDRRMKGYRGPCWAPYLPIDFECVAGIDATFLSAQGALSWLRATHGIDLDRDPDDREGQVAIFFSGNRGVHAQIPLETFGIDYGDAKMPSVLLELIRLLFEGSPYIYRDDQGHYLSDFLDLGIYSPLHMLRYPNTIHEKSGRYKVQMTPSGMEDPPKSIARADRPQPLVAPVPAPTERTLAIGKQAFRNVSLGSCARLPTRVSEGTNPATISDIIKKKAPGLSQFVARNQTLMQMMIGGMEEGEARGGKQGRNNVLHVLACYYRDRKFPPDLAAAALAHWNASNSQPMDEEEFSSVIRSAYDL